MLRLAAEDSADLQVISAQMQDALLKRADLNFDKKRRRFALVANRYAWDGVGQKQRRRAGLHFDDVINVQARGLDKALPATILSLLSIHFEAEKELAGIITLHFSAGFEIRLQVTCLNAAMSDFGGAWDATNTPEHGDHAI